MEERTLGALHGMRLLAFAGIAAPDTFAATLGGLGVHLVDLVVFADHHWYSQADLDRLDGRAGALQVEGLVTTEKDWVRLRRLRWPKRPVYVLSVRLELTVSAQAWQAAFEARCPRR
jgi:tetraacyldisaccharide 4'-kinase